MVKIAGLQKLTLLDYPGKVAATVFTGGCNFCCPFCHNASIVLGKEQTISETDFFAFLNKRKGLLEGVCISGGEPLIQSGLTDFIIKIKSLGYLVKLDTNGSFPDKLKELVKAGLVDYVAMDIKNSPSGYVKTSGITESKNLIDGILESAAFLLTKAVEYEFRTTVVNGFHTTDDFIEIGKWIKGADKCFLQNFTDSGDIIQPGLKGVDQAVMASFANIVREYVPSVQIR